jgi:hypothetical protein
MIHCHILLQCVQLLARIGVGDAIMCYYISAHTAATNTVFIYHDDDDNREAHLVNIPPHSSETRTFLVDCLWTRLYFSLSLMIEEMNMISLHNTNFAYL